MSAVEVVREMARRFRTGGATELFAPGIRIEQPASLPHGGVHEGLDGIARMGALFAEHWTRTITDPRIFGDESSAVQITTQTWTARTTVTVDVVEIFTVENGLITGIRVFPQDTQALLESL